MRINRFVYFSLVFIFLALIFFRPFLSSKIRNFLEGEGGDIKDESLVFENQNLKAELAQLKEIVNRTPKDREDYEFGFVYARYPFNVKNEVLINVGSNRGITEERPVFFGAYSEEEIGKMVLFGSVKKVFKETSLVQTIFSNEWRSEVRVGDKETIAVLEGGSSPTIKLINKDSSIIEGDVIYSADERFPFGLPVGYIKDIGMSSDHLFKEAKLEVPYNLADVGLLMVLK